MSLKLISADGLRQISVSCSSNYSESSLCSPLKQWTILSSSMSIYHFGYSISKDL